MKTSHATTTSEMNTQVKITRPDLIFYSAILLGIILRIVVALQNRSFWWDESINFSESQLPLFDLIRGNYGHFFTHPPVYFLILKLLSLFSVKEIWLRSISIAPSIALIPLLHLFIKRLTKNSLVASLASFFFAVSTFHIYYSSFVKVIEITLLFNVTTLYFFVGYLQHRKNTQLILYCFFLLLSISTSYYSIWLIFMLSFWILSEFFLKKVDRSLLKNICLGSFGVFLIYLPWFTKLIFSFRSTLDMQESTRLIQVADLTSVYANFVSFTNSSPLMIIILILVTLFCIMSFFSRQVKFTLLFWLFFPPLFMYVAIQTMYTSTHSYKFNYSPWYVSFSSLPLYIILASLAVKKLKLLPFIVVAFFLFNFYSFREFLKTPTENWRGASSYLFFILKIDKNDVIFTDDKTHLQYYRNHIWSLSHSPQYRLISAYKLEKTGLSNLFAEIESSLNQFDKSCIASIFIKEQHIPPQLVKYLTQSGFTENPYAFCFTKKV